MGDVEFKEDGSLEVWMRYSKTDSVGKGEVFKISGRRSGGVSGEDLEMVH